MEKFAAYTCITFLVVISLYPMAFALSYLF